MHSLRLILALSVVLAAGPSAFADTIGFALSGDFLNGAFSGTVTFDTTTGYLAGSNFSVSDSGVSDTYSGLADSIDTSPFYTGFTFTGSAGYEFLLALPTPTLAGYAGGDLCTIYSLCTDSSYLAAATAFALDPNTFDYATDGQLTAQPASSQTPEPGTLPLLATGLFCVVCRVRGRRIMV